jgi:maltose alpha-D-glucosyltransferase/alpha-amylase
MLRSFSYAAAVALQQGAAAPDRDKLREPLERWRADTSAAFLEAYGEAIAGTSSYPAEPGVAAQLIDLFTLEKALYELRYEIGNRPAWVGIPLDAVLANLP